jgi:hypothetical protein
MSSWALETRIEIELSSMACQMSSWSMTASRLHGTFAKHDLGADQRLQQLLGRACIDGVHVNAEPFLDVVSRRNRTAILSTGGVNTG